MVMHGAHQGLMSSGELLDAVHPDDAGELIDGGMQAHQDRKDVGVRIVRAQHLDLPLSGIEMRDDLLDAGHALLRPEMFPCGQ